MNANNQTHDGGIMMRKSMDWDVLSDLVTEFQNVSSWFQEAVEPEAVDACIRQIQAVEQKMQAFIRQNGASL